jgi:hypothetical protein
MLLTLLAAALAAANPSFATQVEGKPGTPATSPATTPRFSEAECADFRAWKWWLGETAVPDFVLAAYEAGVAGPARALDPAAFDLAPATARELADLLDAALAELATVETAGGVQELHDAYVAQYAHLAADFRDYADAVEGGADPDQAMTALFTDPEAARLATEYSTLLDGIQVACDTGAEADVAGARNLAALTKVAAEAQAAAGIPAAAQETNEAVLSFLDIFARLVNDFADRVASGAETDAAFGAILPELIASAIPANELLRDLLERCGIPVGVTQPGDGVPPLAEEECDEIFAWYQATAARFADLNAALRESIRLWEFGLELPGGDGAVDLDGEEAD